MTEAQRVAEARETMLALLRELDEGEPAPRGLELFKAAKQKDRTLTFSLLQAALLELIAAKLVRLDSRLHIELPSRAR